MSTCDGRAARQQDPAGHQAQPKRAVQLDQPRLRGDDSRVDAARVHQHPLAVHPDTVLRQEVDLRRHFCLVVRFSTILKIPIFLISH